MNNVISPKLCWWCKYFKWKSQTDYCTCNKEKCNEVVIGEPIKEVEEC